MIQYTPGYKPKTSKEFVVGEDDFTELEIRAGDGNTGFHYFYDTENSRLITDFTLDDRPQVATLCHVKLIKKDGQYSPRIKLWKKDKTKIPTRTLELLVPESETTKVIKAMVDTDDCHKNFWKVIRFLESFADVDVPDYDFRVVSGDGAQLAKALEGTDKKTIIEAVRISIGDQITEDDLRLMGIRKAQLQRFEKLLNDEDFFENEKVSLGENTKTERVWQIFFEENPWIFGYGLNLIACESLDEARLEQITTGANIFTGAGKRSDAVLRSKGYISSLVFCEIKTSNTDLLGAVPYRKPDVYQPSKELSGGVSQVQKTGHKAIAKLTAELVRLYRDDGTPTGIEVSTVRPRQVLVIGNLEQFKQNGAINPERWSSFELYRRGIPDVEIITFDELYERACFIVRDESPDRA